MNSLRECARPALKVKASKYVKLLCVHFISRCLYSDGERGTRHSLFRVCWELRVLKGQKTGSGEVAAKLK